MQVEGHRGRASAFPPATGARVSNAYPTCPWLGDNLAKASLIPHGLIPGHPGLSKGFPAMDGDASD